MIRKLDGANGPASGRSTICRSRPAGKGRVWPCGGRALDEGLDSPWAVAGRGRDRERWPRARPLTSRSTRAKPCSQPGRGEQFGRNYGGSWATIVAGSQQLVNIWANRGLAIACAAFWPHPSLKSCLRRAKQPQRSRRRRVPQGSREPECVAGETGSQWTPRPASRNDCRAGM
jgi:hypothetical protein